MLGGISGRHRELLSGDDAYSRFEQTIARLFRDDLKSGAMNGSELWSALANVTWWHGDSEVGYSFRAAGDLIALCQSCAAKTMLGEVVELSTEIKTLTGYKRCAPN